MFLRPARAKGGLQPEEARLCLLPAQITFRLHARKGVAFRPFVHPYRVRERRKKEAKMDQALHLLDIGEAPISECAGSIIRSNSHL